VEDEEIVRKLSVKILTGLGYSVLEAANGVEALQIFKSNAATIDLLLTDVIMPKMNGSELAAEVKELNPEIKVLFMSGYTEDAVIKHGILTDGINYLHKPVTPSNLSKAVREILDLT
jgi:CheY-like chemotaxis protein